MAKKEFKISVTNFWMHFIQPNNFGGILNEYIEHYEKIIKLQEKAMKNLSSNNTAISKGFRDEFNPNKSKGYSPMRPSSETTTD